MNKQPTPEQIGELVDQVDWEKGNGLVPVPVLGPDGQILMLGYMNPKAMELTIATGLITFWSRKRDELWVKGETSGNFLELVELGLDCDGDALFAKAKPTGPTCHLGSESCFRPVWTPDVPRGATGVIRPAI